MLDNCRHLFCVNCYVRMRAINLLLQEMALQLSILHPIPKVHRIYIGSKRWSSCIGLIRSFDCCMVQFWFKAKSYYHQIVLTTILLIKSTLLPATSSFSNSVACFNQIQILRIRPMENILTSSTTHERDIVCDSVRGVSMLTTWPLQK